jgi:hypothetical protein
VFVLKHILPVAQMIRRSAVECARSKKPLACVMNSADSEVSSVSSHDSNDTYHVLFIVYEDNESDIYSVLLEKAAKVKTTVILCNIGTKIVLRYLWVLSYILRCELFY